MIKLKRIIFWFFLFLSFVPACYAGLKFQDFEANNGAIVYGWPLSAEVSVNFSSSREPAHSGTRSWKMVGQYWAGTGISSQTDPADTDFNPTINDRLSFWIYSLPEAGGDHTVGVKFSDNSLYRSLGFEVWTTKTANHGKWTELSILFSQLPPDFDLRHVTYLEFKMYWPGTYYFDDIVAARKDRSYQVFEPQLRSGSTVNEYGWKWNEIDVIGFSQGFEPVHQGEYSWKLISNSKWAGTGIQSEEKRLFNGAGGYEQSFWHVDLHPEKNSNLVLWVHGEPQNLLDNNPGIQFYDHGNHASDDTKAVVWPNKAAGFGKWTRFTVPFSQLPTSLNLRDLDKIQLQQYWPGTYYFDEIKACAALLKIDEESLNRGVVKWDRIKDACKYILEESKVGSSGPWDIVYEGTANSFNVTGLSKLWYRVRWQECVSVSNTIPYSSEYSDAAEYVPPPIFIKSQKLRNGIVDWRVIPQADIYEVESAQNENGPWTRIYRGHYLPNRIRATNGSWYRVRALQRSLGVVLSMTEWSKPKRYAPKKGFLRAQGLSIKDDLGGEILLEGVNLGSLFLIEPWMTGIGEGDNPAISDEWNMRSVLTERFGKAKCKRFFNAYYQAYADEADFDYLSNLGVNTVRLPINYLLLQDETGKWVRNASGQIDFSKIDRIVNLCADRGIYVLLDLHGAPGAQSNEAHTGRQNYNKLFEDSPLGIDFRKRTVEVWEAIAKHYKNNPTVCGYDLLNEPVGAPSLDALWKLYDGIYRAIRAIDTDHIIMMEGIWGPETLPDPRQFSWENVVYQFHWYFWEHNEDIAAHRQFIYEQSQKIKEMQENFNIPVMIGEFNCFNMRQIWDQYLREFRFQKWSWAMWSYKSRYSPSEWGLFNHSGYDLELPKLRSDIFNILVEKLSAYTTLNHHSPNYSLSRVIEEYCISVQSAPFIKRITPETVPAGSQIIIEGVNFGNSVGSSLVMFEGKPLPVTAWSNTLIKAVIPVDEPKNCGMLKVFTQTSESNERVLQVIKLPVITIATPSQAPIGVEVTVLGGNFGRAQGKVLFSSSLGEPVLAAITYWNTGKIKFVVPYGAASGAVTIKAVYGSASFNFIFTE